MTTVEIILTVLVIILTGGGVFSAYKWFYWKRYCDLFLTPTKNAEKDITAHQEQELIARLEDYKSQAAEYKTDLHDMLNELGHRQQQLDLLAEQKLQLQTTINNNANTIIHQNKNIVSSQNTINDCNTTISTCRETIKKLQESIKSFQERELAAHENYDKYVNDHDCKMQALADQYKLENDKLTSQYKVESEKLNNLYKVENDKINNCRIQLEQMEKEVEDKTNRLKLLTSDELVLNSKMAELGRLIEEQKSLYENSVIAVAQKELENSKGIIELSDNDKKVLSLINDIIMNYPSMSEDLRRIAWSKIWLPKMQEVASGANGVSGIYKLSVVGNEACCYVGQATDIKVRWYQHAKKMVGIEKSGNERLYCKVGNSPSAVRWEIIDVVPEDINKVDQGKWLNEHERYWIDFYGCCTEIGLNKKIGIN